MTIERRIPLGAIVEVFLVLTCAPGRRLRAQTPHSVAVPSPSGHETGGGALADAARTKSLLKARLGQSLVVADLNRGLADVALVDCLADSVKLSFGEASGGFGSTASLAGGRGPRLRPISNNDGVIDLAVGEFLSGSVRAFIGRGDGRFADGVALLLAEGISSPIARDIDGDGRVDLPAANALSRAIVLLKKAGQGSFVPTEVGRASHSRSDNVNGP